MDDLERRLKEHELPSGPPESTLTAVAERAEREGLVDVAYTTFDSPLGELLLAATPTGLARVAYPSTTSTPCWRTWRRACRREWSSRRGGWTTHGASWMSTSRASGTSSTCRWTCR